MGTKIRANAFLHEYHSLIDLDGSTSNGMRSLYHGNRAVKNGDNPDSLKSYDPEKVKQTILQHESIFRNQLQELHRLYRRQQELMNEIKRRDMNKDNVKEAPQSSYLFSPVSPEDAKGTWNSCHSSSVHSMAGFLVDKSEPQLSKSSIFHSGTYNLGVTADVYCNNTEKQLQESFSKSAVVDSTSRSRNHQASYDRDTKLSLSAVQTSQCNADAFTFNLHFKRTNNPGDLRITNPTDRIPDSLMLSRGEVSANSCSKFNPVTKDLFRSSMAGMKGESSSFLGFTNEKNDYAEGRRFDKHSSVGDLFSGKSAAFPQKLLAEPRQEFLKCRKKIFGVEISEGNDDPFKAPSNMSSTLDQKVQKNRVVASFEPSSWIANSFVRNLELGETNVKERSKADLKGPYQCAQNDPIKCFKNLEDLNSEPAEVSKKDSENSQKFRPMIPQHFVLADCQIKQESPKRGLPWFLRNSQVNGDLSKGKKSSYFMNLDSLQNSSQEFFKKAEIADGTFQTSKQKKDPNGGINEVVDGTSDKKILGFPISNMFQSSGVGGDSARKVEMDECNRKDQLETEDLVLHKGLNDYIADLRHHIDLNLSLDEEDAPSAPSLPTAIVKIATKEIDLEAPAVIESETDKNMTKMDASPGKHEVTFEECDKSAAEAIIAISLFACEPPEAAFDNSLKWFAEIVSSQYDNAARIHVKVSLDQNGASDEEESIPNGMDFFEFMTLKLEETKEEHCHYEPVVLNNPNDDETGATLCKRSRRGQSRRGRQRKDFQRDILPGLVTLSRLEVTEDFQAFEEILKPEGGTRLSQRNGRGRKRSGGRNTSPTTKTLCTAQAQQPICQLEERSLTGWGKRTRRLPRQRCPNAILSFPVKC